MENSLQNAKVDLRVCNHKTVSFEAWIMTDQSGLEYKICKKCYQKFRYYKGLTFAPCARTTEPKPV